MRPTGLCQFTAGRLWRYTGPRPQDGADVLQWTDNDSDNQRFELELLSGGGGSGGDGGSTSSFDVDVGFADTSWFDDSVDVITGSEPTRSAVESAFQTSGPRLVVFETSGTIDLGDTVIEGGTVYLEDNSTDPSSTPLTGGVEELSSRPLWPSGLEAVGSGSVETHNLSYAGARPADRTADDARVIDEIDSRAGDDYIDSPYAYWVAHPDDVGGYPTLAENTHSLSIPSSGLRDWLEQWALAVEDPNASPP